MDNAAVHKAIHQKNQQKRDEISLNGEIQLIPAYYGETLFEKIQPSNESIISKAALSLMNNTPSDDLPPLLRDLLKDDPEQVLSQLIEYYTRLNILKQLNS